MNLKRKDILFGIGTVVFFFLLLEGIARLFYLPGSFDYIERCIIEQGLAEKKPKDEYRIFLYGESTAHGHVFFPKSTIRLWTKLYLENLLGEETAKNVKLVNFGRLGADSNFITQSFLDTLVYKPDLVIFYTAHNDFANLDNRRAIFYRMSVSENIGQFFNHIIKKSSFIRILRIANIKAKMTRNSKKECKNKKSKFDRWYVEEKNKIDINANLLEPGSKEFNIVKEHWEGNIRRIIKVAQNHKIPIIFFEGVARYRDYPPFESKHLYLLNQQDLLKWTDLNNQAEEYFIRGQYQQASELYKKCLEIDREYAMTYFRLGQCLKKLKDYAEAKKNYLMANDKDYFPIRAPQVVNQYYDELRRQHLRGVHVIKTQKVFEEKSPNGIIDNSLILDQIHPTIKGQALMALEVVRLMYEEGYYADKKSWRWDDLKPMEELKEKLNIDQDFQFAVYVHSARYVGSYFDEAIEYLKKALEIKPDSIIARSQLAWTYWKKGDKKEAIDLYKQLSQEDPQQASEFFKKYPEIEKEIMKP